MYTFHPLADTTLTHTGWYIWATLMVIVVLFLLRGVWEEELGLGGLLAFLASFGLLTLVVYAASYGGTKPVNAQYTATFVKYQPEGHSETQHTGKTTRQVDVHEIYVVYRIDDTGNEVILSATTGKEYPKNIVLYKN